MGSIQRMSSVVSSKSTEKGLDIDKSVSHDAQLGEFGYEQELKRSFGLLGMIGFSFSIVTSWTALGGVLVVGIESGGPPVMVWSWIGVCVLTLFVAYSFAEMCSAYPLAGGQYSWVAILSPPRVARPLSWITGWFMNTGIVAMGATNNFVAANFVLGIAQLNNPSYVIERWHTVLVAYFIAIICAAFNIFLSPYLNKLSSAVLMWNVLSFVVVIVTILATKKHYQSASFVFSEFQNDTGFSSGGMAVMIGLLQSFFGMCCYDAPSKMVEEMKSPSTEAPKAIIASVYLGAITGFIFLVSAFFCIGDLDGVANSATGVPLIQIFYDSTQNIAGASVLAAMISVIVIVAGNSLTAEGSRGLWAFSRDNGLPYSSIFSQVNKKLSVPVYSILLCMILQMGLNSIYFASYEGFSTVISIAALGFYVSYAMPLAVRLLSSFTGHAKVIPGAYSLGKWGPLINGIGLVFLLFGIIDINFPSIGPVDADNMNYCSAAIGIIGLISLITWVIDGRKNFTGPQTGPILNAVEAEDKGIPLGADGHGFESEKGT